MTASGDRRWSSQSDSRVGLLGTAQATWPRVLKLAGGSGAPARARHWARSCLAGTPLGISWDDLALIVSELVTNSVVHARVDASRELTITAASRPGGWRITVSDSGSDTEPRLRSHELNASCGLGLQIVDRLCTDWGSFRDADRATHVWCDVPRLPGATG